MRMPWLTEDQKFAVGATIIFIGAAIVLASLTGCASVFEAEYFDWRQEREPAGMAYSVVYVDPALVATACGKNVRACTIHSQRIIYLPEGAPVWMLEHERRHEGGENHSGQVYEPLKG